MTQELVILSGEVQTMEKKKTKNLTNYIKALVISNQKCKFVTKYRQNGKMYLHGNLKCHNNDTQQAPSKCQKSVCIPANFSFQNRT